MSPHHFAYKRCQGNGDRYLRPHFACFDRFFAYFPQRGQVPPSPFHLFWPVFRIFPPKGSGTSVPTSVPIYAHGAQKGRMPESASGVPARTIWHTPYNIYIYYLTFCCESWSCIWSWLCCIFFLRICDLYTNIAVSTDTHTNISTHITNIMPVVMF